MARGRGAVIIAILIFVPAHHQSAASSSAKINNTGFSGGIDGGSPSGSWCSDRLPPDDVHADRLRRVRAHGRGDARTPRSSAAQGVWRSVFYSAIARVGRAARASCSRRTTSGPSTRRGGGSIPIFTSRPELVGGQGGDHDLDRGPAVLRAGWPDQRVAHVVRVLARPRDARLVDVPAAQPATVCPFNAVLGVSVASLIITIPALWGTRPASRWRSSRSPGSAPSACTSPTSSRCT